MERIICGRTLDELKKLEDGSIDLILQDPPYNCLEVAWEEDIFADGDELLNEVKRVLKPNGTMILFTSGPFTFRSQVYFSELFRYKYVWLKQKSTNFIHSKNKPMTKHEDILIFSKGVAAHLGQSERRMTYNPQGLIAIAPVTRKTNKENKNHATPIRTSKESYTTSWKNYPCDVLSGFPETSPNNKIHTSEKPVDLLMYLINTFSNEGEIVFDGYAGSFSTAEAALRTNRQFICVDKIPEFVEKGINRIEALRR